MKARVYVTLAAGVLDARGQAVQKTLARLGFDEVGGVRVGTYIELELTRPAGRAGDDMDVDEMRARVQAMCEQLLANPVIEEYRVELGGESEGEPQTEPRTEIDG